MTKIGNPYPVGLNFGGTAAQKMDARLDRLRTENARRRKCSLCDLRILPEGMARHVAIVHDDD